MSWFGTFKEILEILYYAAGTGMIITLILGLKQLKVMKQDIEIRNKREAVEKSMFYLGEFSKNTIPKMNKIMSSITDEDIPNMTASMNEMFLPDETHKDEEVQSFIHKVNKAGALDILNQLEFFSAAIIHGLADEEVAYKPTVKTYTSMVAFLYPSICNYRANDLHGFTNIMELFKIWNGKLQKDNMQLAKQQLEQNISKIPDVKFKSIGVK